jgi:hypothetical protein
LPVESVKKMSFPRSVDVAKFTKQICNMRPKRGTDLETYTKNRMILLSSHKNNDLILYMI